MSLDVAELPASPRRRDLSFYLAFFCFVLPFWSVTPLSWTFLIYAFHSGLRAWRDRILFAFALSEVRYPVYNRYALTP